MIGLTSGKAVLLINGKPRTLAVGESVDGMKLLGADSAAAVFEVDGKRSSFGIGQSISSTYASPQSAAVTLTADSGGHFVTTGSINGMPVKFLVDTGATLVSMGASEARRLGINYLQGERGFTSTANGLAAVYKVKLDNVKLGDIALYSVDGAVHEDDGLPIVLLGMSFLNRVEMRREGVGMTLTKRY